MPDLTPDPEFERAIAAEPRLRTVVTLVDALIELTRPDDTLCGSCVWEDIVKPLVSPLIGWERGYPPAVAKDKPAVTEDPDTWPLVSGADWLAESEAADKQRIPATTDTEKWLRTTEAWDAFTRILIDRLETADPGNGHGIARHREDTKEQS